MYLERVLQTTNLPSSRVEHIFYRCVSPMFLLPTVFTYTFFNRYALPAVDFLIGIYEYGYHIVHTRTPRVRPTHTHRHTLQTCR